MKTIGSILLDVELVTQEDIDEALTLQKQTGQRLGEVLVNLGVVSDDDIRWALAEQLNLPYVNIRKDQIDTDVAMMLPEKLARRYHVIPILKIDDELTVVVDDPLNTTIIQDIEAITKSRVKLSLGRTSDIMLAIDELYGRTDDAIQKLPETPPSFLSPWFSEEDIQNILNDPSGHVLMQVVLEKALMHQISRVYFQPGFKACYISYRVKGVLQHQIQLDTEWYSIAMFRLKISAGIELSRSRSPKYREFSYWDNVVRQVAPEGEEQVSVALSIFPTEAGESAVLRFINKSFEKMEELDGDAPTISSSKAELQDILKIKTALPYLQSGAVFLAGSPYPDKITTLYSLLQGIDHQRKKIVTLESYTEYCTDKYAQIRYGSEDSPDLPGGHIVPDPGQETQVSDTEKRDLREDPSQQRLFSWLKTLEQQDADVIVVDHIASPSVMSHCIGQAASRLVLGAFDFKQVFDVLAYCLDCQIKPSVLASQIYALIAQHTLHLLCDECKQEDTTEFAQQFLNQLPPEFAKQRQEPAKIFRPAGGCPACSMTGYMERSVLFEVLIMEPWLKDMLVANCPVHEIRQVATEHDFVSLEQKSIALLLAGQTSIEQILSVVAQKV